MRRKFAIMVLLVFVVGSFYFSYLPCADSRTLIIQPADNKYDLVDGSPITRNSRFKTSYGNKWYRFNSYGNLKIFKENPEYYVKKQVTSSPTRRTVTSSQPGTSRSGARKSSSRSQRTTSDRRTNR